MLLSQPLLNVAAPPVLKQQEQVVQALPVGHRPKFATAQPLLHRFDAGNQNYVLQQFYNRGGIQLGLVTLRLQQYSLFQLQCATPLAPLMYTLDGRAIAGLQRQSVLPCTAFTYTLQYLPAGPHPLLLPPGRFRFFYLCADKGMDFLQPHNPQVQALHAHIKAHSQQALVAGRLPLTDAILQQIDRVLELPASNGHTGLQLAQLVHGLLGLYHAQSLQPAAPYSTIAARAACIIADHLLWPERALLQFLRKELQLNQDALHYYWKKQNRGSISQYIILCRMEYALYLLLVQQHTIADVADLLGYENRYSFTEQFKKELGFAPRQLLKYVLSS